MPGFISGHTHVAGGTATRGIIEGGRSFARPLVVADGLSDADLDALTAYNLAELLRGGCTTQLEMSLSLKQAESYIRVARKWGVRGYPGGMIPGSTGSSPCGSARPIRRCWTPFPTRWPRSWPTAPSACATTAPRTGASCRRRHRTRRIPTRPRRCRRWPQRRATWATGMHWYLSQSANETRAVKRLWGKRPVEWLDEFGMYDAPLFGAHMSGIDLVEDPPILKAKGAVYAHCPSAGGAGSGTQPWPELLGRRRADEHRDRHPLERLSREPQARGPLRSGSALAHRRVKPGSARESDDLGRSAVGDDHPCAGIGARRPRTHRHRRQGRPGQRRRHGSPFGHRRGPARAAEQPPVRPRPVRPPRHDGRPAAGPRREARRR